MTVMRGVPGLTGFWFDGWRRDKIDTTKWHIEELRATDHDGVIKWRRHFPRYWPFVRGIHRSPVNSPHKGQWRGALMLPLICAWIHGYANNREAGDSRRHRAHYDVTVMLTRKGRDWMAAIFQTTCLNGFCWMKMYEFGLKFHWSLLLGV